MLGLPRGAEWIIILVIVILLFGPGASAKLPVNLAAVLSLSVMGWAAKKNRPNRLKQKKRTSKDPKAGRQTATCFYLSSCALNTDGSLVGCLHINPSHT